MPHDDPAEGLSRGPQRGDPAVVLVAGELGQAEIGLGGDEDLAHPAGAVVAVGLAVEQAEAVAGLAVLADEPVPQHLQPGADGQHGRPALDGVGERASRPQLLGGERLGGVLASAHQVDLAAAGDRLAGVDVDHLGGDAAPAQPLGEHRGVATVAVRPEQLGIEQGDGDRLSHFAARR